MEYFVPKSEDQSDDHCIENSVSKLGVRAPNSNVTSRHVNTRHAAPTTSCNIIKAQFSFISIYFQHTNNHSGVM